MSHPGANMVGMPELPEPERESFDDSLAALRTSNEELAEFFRELEQAQRRGTEEARAERRRLRRWLLVDITAITVTGVMAALHDNTWARVLWLIATITAALSCGLILAIRMVLRQREMAVEHIDSAASAADHRAMLVRINDSLSAYPNLWPSAVPIIAAAVGAVAVVVVTFLNLLAS